MEPLTALIVEDDPSNQHLAALILRHAGFLVQTCHSGLRAVERCVQEGERYDVILMDHDLPDMDGLQAARHLRAHPGTRDIPIVAVSGRADELAVDEPTAFDTFVRKPYRRVDFQQAVRDALFAKGRMAR